MRSFDLSDGKNSGFKDPYKWISDVPPFAKEGLKAFGLGCDWRRSFINSDMNLYYDSFVWWQMRKLKGMGEIVKDVKYTIYSPLDGQPCPDHDKASGEGVQPQDYLLIKMEMIPPFLSKLKVWKVKTFFWQQQHCGLKQCMGKQIVGSCWRGSMELLKLMRLMRSFLHGDLLLILHIISYQGF